MDGTAYLCSVWQRMLDLDMTRKTCASAETAEVELSTDDETELKCEVIKEENGMTRSWVCKTFWEVQAEVQRRTVFARRTPSTNADARLPPGTRTVTCHSSTPLDRTPERYRTFEGLLCQSANTDSRPHARTSDNADSS